MEFGVGFGPKRPGEEQFGAQGPPQPLGPLDLLFVGVGVPRRLLKDGAMKKKRGPASMHHCHGARALDKLC